MKINFKVLILFAIVGIIILSILALQDEAKPSTDSEESLNVIENPLTAERKAKDQYLKNSADSPIEDKENFKGLSYFPLSEKFKILAKISKITNSSKINISFSGGEQEEFESFAKCNFILNGKVSQLTIYKSKTASLFLPFNDLTNGKSTYGGGRYLDLEENAIKGDALELDFNNAYQPYCAYNHNFTCPVPPAENKLEVEILAGENWKIGSMEIFTMHRI